ncbi:hypothetical protein M2444_003535 [Paenibacillus sp. PastF-3]|uniref:hypothetical protein n=1 Tax=Paenibacillus sp. PastF-3 TaxID=2940626 RepID=UPI002476A5BE|nr:hypothetical protein [Paenibacillus sp. PastF-3]MDH6371736.1 hypothetical protein [Paenibacillus sp. PastF-3]
MMDQILSEVEVQFLDNLLSDVSKLPRSFRNLNDFRREWRNLQGDGSEDCSEELRIKGILDNTWVDVYDVHEDNGLENILQSKLEVCTFNIEVFLKYWVTTLIYKSGKNANEIDFTQISRGINGFSLPISIGTDRVKVFFITNDISGGELENKSDGAYVSFIGDLSLPNETYIDWYDPIYHDQSATRFFVWLKEQSKPSMSKMYSFVNLPTDLESAQKEDVLKLINSYLSYLSYNRRNSPENFQPESNEYFFPESTIRDCFVKHEGSTKRKIFVVINENRVEFHTFIDGIKSYDENLSLNIENLQIWIDKKTAENRRILLKKGLSLIDELIKIVPILIVALASAVSSVKILATNSEFLNFKESKFWLIGHISVSIIAVVFLIVIGIVPHLKMWIFSWERGLEKYAKKTLRTQGTAPQR